MAFLEQLTHGSVNNLANRLFIVDDLQVPVLQERFNGFVSINIYFIVICVLKSQNAHTNFNL